MYQQTPIICPHCNKHSGYTQENMMYFVMTCDLYCMNCHGIVIKCYGPKWTTEVNRDPYNPENNWITHNMSDCSTLVRPNEGPKLVRTGV